jgi:nitrogen fixation NifU-like protein
MIKKHGNFLLDNLYQDTILDHSRHPKNFGKIKNPDFYFCGYNPICGDCIKIFVILKNKKIENIKFKGDGCTIFLSSSSLMTEMIINQNIESILRKFEFIKKIFIEGKKISSEKSKKILGDFFLLKRIVKFPSRIECVMLPWNTIYKNLILKLNSIKN